MKIKDIKRKISISIHQGTDGKEEVFFFYIDTYYSKYTILSPSSIIQMTSIDDKRHCPTAKKEGLQPPAKKSKTGEATREPYDMIKLSKAVDRVTNEIEKHVNDYDTEEEDEPYGDNENWYWKEEFDLNRTVLERMGKKLLKNEEFCAIVMKGRGECKGCPVARALEGEHIDSREDKKCKVANDEKMNKEQVKAHCEKCGYDAFLHRLVLVLMA